MFKHRFLFGAHVPAGWGLEVEVSIQRGVFFKGVYFFDSFCLSSNREHAFASFTVLGHCITSTRASL